MYILGTYGQNFETFNISAAPVTNFQSFFQGGGGGKFNICGLAHTASRPFICVNRFVPELSWFYGDEACPSVIVLCCSPVMPHTRARTHAHTYTHAGTHANMQKEEKEAAAVAEAARSAVEELVV